jgi:hypothetical protein
MVAADNELPAGEHQVRMEFANDGGGTKGTTVSYIDGTKAGEGRVDATQAMNFSGERSPISAGQCHPGQ